MEDNKMKRSRGSNYTPVEKETLLNIIIKYKQIIEDKKTDGRTVMLKKKCWQEIVQSYNALATSGPRTVDQLKTLYDQLKRSLRKHVAEENKTKYLEKSTDNVEIDEALRKQHADKVEMKKTGGGTVKPQLDEASAQILAILQEQIEPLPNPFDCAATFFGNHQEIQAGPSSAPQPPIIPEHSKHLEEIQAGCSSAPQPSILTNNLPRPPKKTFLTLYKKMNAEQLKRSYFRIKIKNALLQRQLMLKQDRLDTAVKRLKVKKLQSLQ